MTEQRTIRVLIADDREIARLGTVALLGTQPGFTVVAQADDGVAAINLYREHKPDVLVLDMKMPALDGIQVAATLCREDAGARILMLSHYESEADITAALRAGARGYLTKETTGTELIAAIRSVAEGKRYVPAALASRLADSLAAEALSPREQQVLRELYTGKKNHEIAQVLSISRWTVALHVKNLLAKLGARTRTEAVSIAIQRGLIRRD